MEIGFVSNALHEAFENSDFYDLGYNRQCDNYCDMYDNGRNALCEAFNSALSERLSSMTNGDVIKAMFPDNEGTPEALYGNTVYYGNANYDKTWWDAPYKRG